MFLSCTQIMILVTLFSGALIVGQIGSFITIPEPVIDVSSVAKSSPLPPALLNNEDKGIFVFLQITDLHVSMFVDPERFSQLKDFCRVNVKTINPMLVLASGDLTDAIAPDKIVAKQFEQEWEMYRQFHKRCLQESGVKEWLDLRGNHDNFNVNGLNSSNNYYPIFGAQNHRHPGSYMVTIDASHSTKYNNTKYAFVAVDATLDLGPKRILNFVGELDSSRLTKLQQFQQSIDQAHVNGSIWFGHYPSSSILSARPDFRSVAAKSIAYLCGHFHNLGGLVPEMYSHHHSGLLELELSDWKINRMYRVAVLDHGLFSFVDVKYQKWPIIIVTNPKSVLTLQPAKEPVGLMAASSHIRLLIYSPSPVVLCEVKIDDGPWQPCMSSGDHHPLYTAAWSPENYSNGLHSLEVRAKNSNGSESSTQIEFSLDGTRSSFSIASRLTLMMDITTFFQVLFGIFVASCIIPFCIVRFIHQRVLSRQMTLHRFRNGFIHKWVRRLWIFANVDGIFYPFAIYTIYLCFGPWFVGHLIDDHMGVVFVWGTFFTDTFLPGTLTYFYGLTHLLMFNIPLIFLLAHAGDLSLQAVTARSRHNQRSWTRHFRHLCFILFLVGHLSSCVPFWIAYGALATIVNPMRTGGMVLSLCLWSKALRLTESDLADISKVWI